MQCVCVRAAVDVVVYTRLARSPYIDSTLPVVRHWFLNMSNQKEHIPYGKINVFQCSFNISLHLVRTCMCVCDKIMILCPCVRTPTPFLTTTCILMISVCMCECKEPVSHMCVWVFHTYRSRCRVPDTTVIQARQSHRTEMRNILHGVTHCRYISRTLIYLYVS